MATILENRPGGAAALAGDVDVPLALAVDGWGGYAGFRAIITEISVALDGNYQFLHTCSDLVYVYVFGDRVSQIRVAGLAFADSCEAFGGTGFEQVLAFYRLNRIANRPTPSQLQIGLGPAGYFQGYLTSFKGDIFKPEARLTAFGLVYHVFPGARL